MTRDEQLENIRQWQEDVSLLYDFALTHPGQRQSGLLLVRAELAARYLAATGVAVDGFRYVLDAATIRHVHAGHGGKSEASHKRITKQDILNLHLVMTDPDTITLSPKKHRGLTAIKISKIIAGQKSCCVITVRDGKKRLSPVTCYKG